MRHHSCLLLQIRRQVHMHQGHTAAHECTCTGCDLHAAGTARWLLMDQRATWSLAVATAGTISLVHTTDRCHSVCDHKCPTLTLLYMTYCSPRSHLAKTAVLKAIILWSRDQNNKCWLIRFISNGSFPGDVIRTAPGENLINFVCVLSNFKVFLANNSAKNGYIW